MTTWLNNAVQRTRLGHQGCNPRISACHAVALALLFAIILTGCSSLDYRQTYSIRPYLSGIQEFLQGYVDAESTNQLDFFFVSPVRKERGDAFAYAYWMTGNSIIILDLPVGKMENYFWYSYKARVDLATDVVPTSEDIGGSTYLVDAPWAENIIRESLQSGVKFVVQKKIANHTLQRAVRHPHAP